MPDKEDTNFPPTYGYFATPVYRVLAGHKEKLDALKELLLSKEVTEFEHPKSPQKSHSAVFESRFDMFGWPDHEIGLLKNQIYAHLMQYLRDVNGFDEATLKQVQFRSESWYHVTRKGGYFQAHNHPLASVSVIYCVDPGDEIIENEFEAGHVVMTDPRFNASMYVDPANASMLRPYSFDGIRFRLQKDEICIFPSYLQHSVEPYAGDRPRITVAANFSFGLK